MRITAESQSTLRNAGQAGLNPNSEIELPQKNTARLMPHPKQQSEDEDEDEDEKEEFAQAAETLLDSSTKNTKEGAERIFQRIITCLVLAFRISASGFMFFVPQSIKLFAACANLFVLVLVLEFSDFRLRG